MEQEKKRDPLNVLLNRARERKIDITQAELEKLEADVGKAVEAALRAAEEGPQPDVASIWQDIYASAEDPALHRDI